MKLLHASFAASLCLLAAACQEPAAPPAVETPVDTQSAVAAAPSPAAEAGPAALVGQSSQCPPGAAPFNLAPWLGADITVACGLRSERKHVTASGIARYQVTYEYTTKTPQKELAVLDNAMKAAGFVEKSGADEQAIQRIYFKKGFDSVNIWANPEKKPDFKDPLANGAIGIDMSDIASAASTSPAAN
jgi:hypothetical protein